MKEVHQVLDKLSWGSSYLEDCGWLRTMETGQVVDRDGKPIPWITYPAYDFLKSRVAPALSVFEYGSGNSTLWWSERVKRLISCEHDKEWYADFQLRVPEGVSYLFRRCKGGSEAYFREISRYSKEFDIIVLDGRQRVQCALNAVGALTDEGVFLWDNSDRESYQPGFEYLLTEGFKRLDFWGMGPLSTRRWCTSLFYRQRNCLGI